MRIILCGFGVVGQSFAKLLESRSEDLYARYGLKPRIVGVFDRNGSAIDPSGLDINRLIDVKKNNMNLIQIEFNYVRFVFLFFIISNNSFSHNSLDSLYTILNQEMINSVEYNKTKELRIANLNIELENSKSLKDQYEKRKKYNFRTLMCCFPTSSFTI